MDDLPEQHVQSYERPEQRDLTADELSERVRALLDQHRSRNRTVRPRVPGK